MLVFLSLIVVGVICYTSFTILNIQSYRASRVIPEVPVPEGVVLAKQEIKSLYDTYQEEKLIAMNYYITHNQVDKAIQFYDKEASHCGKHNDSSQTTCDGYTDNIGINRYLVRIDPANVDQFGVLT